MNPQSLSKKKQLRKLFRFYTIYGLKRTINKALGRIRHPKVKALGFKKDPIVSIIGSGQFAFTTISYFIKKNKGLIFLDCYDIEKNNAESLANYYKFQKAESDPETLIRNPKLKFLYIASNHSTHTDYAIQAMAQGIKTIYMEKPISTTYEQFYELTAKKRETGTTLYAGYNRPYSKAVQFLKKSIAENPPENSNSAFSINYFISGHLIPNDHWYRNYEEGTRICGNMGHWLDLTIHILRWRKLPKWLKIQIAYSNLEEPDDNITISMTSDFGDLASIMLTSRCEPFEGINESVNFQYGNTIAKIDDFRKLTVWREDELIKKKFYPKDVGHERAIMQPFLKDNRDWEEVEISTLLMLHITDMVRSKNSESVFDIKQSQAVLEKRTTKLNNPIQQ